MSTVYFCWLCDRPADGKISDTSYDTDRKVFFCSGSHWAFFMELKAL